MSGEETLSNPLSDFVRPLLGLPAWSVQQGYGSFLMFEFGEPKLEVREGQYRDQGLRRSAYVHGEWHLWIYCCHWRAIQDGNELAWSEDSDDLIRRAAAAFDGQKLVAVNVVPDECRSSFTFDLGGLLETWPYGDDDTVEQWSIVRKTQSFAFRADGMYRQGPTDVPPNVERWLPLHEHPRHTRAV